MYIERLWLKDYRNYHNIDLSFEKGVNIIVGPNAQGKTNLLEAIYFLSTGTSHRGGRTLELVRWSADSFQIKGSVFSQGRSHELDIRFSGTKKTIALDGVFLMRVSELLGITNVVLFSPDDLQLVKGGPGFRRKFLNVALCRISPLYRENLMEYERILTQRNNLLRSEPRERGRKFTEHLSIWDEGLTRTGAVVMAKRAEALDRFSAHAKVLHGKITSGHETLELIYEPSFNTLGFSRDELRNGFEAKLKAMRQVEIQRRVTMIGPHRDDFKILINSTDARVYGSQGQQRTSVLSLKLAELEYLKEEAGEYPILLLDDVMSELDKSRRNYLMQTLDRDMQTFITTTDLGDLLDGIKGGGRVFRFKDGALVKE